jgi:hypothetical protein
MPGTPLSLQYHTAGQPDSGVIPAGDVDCDQIRQASVIRNQERFSASMKIRRIRGKQCLVDLPIIDSRLDMPILS